MTPNTTDFARLAAGLIVVTAMLAPLGHAQESDGPAPYRGGEIGNLEPLQVGDTETTFIAMGYLEGASQTEIIREPGASSIKVHFVDVALEPGVTVTVSDSTGKESYTYPGDSYTTHDGPGFWALTVTGEMAEVRLDGSEVGLERSGLVIDMYAWGYPLDVLYGPPVETVCGAEDRLDVVCYEQTYPVEFDQSSASALARITTPQGTFSCTGWRLGPGPHMMTNEHCVTDQDELDYTEFWFNYQRVTCGSGGSSPVTRVSGDTFLVDNDNLDFALVTIENPAAVEEFGYLELDPRMPVLGEEIYIPGHGDGVFKRYALESDMNTGGLCAIDDAIRNGNAPNTDTGYFCDSSGGQSGSPVIARSSRKVIALHHFGTGSTPCGGNVMNAGVRIDRIWLIIQNYLGSLFEDGFESGGTSGWSSTYP